MFYSLFYIYDTYYLVLLVQVTLCINGKYIFKVKNKLNSKVINNIVTVSDWKQLSIITVHMQIIIVLSALPKTRLPTRSFGKMVNIIILEHQTSMDWMWLKIITAKSYYLYISNQNNLK